MTVGYGANFAMVIEEEKIKEMNLGSYTNFLQALKEKNVSLDEYASSVKNSNFIYDESGNQLADADAEHLDGCFKWFQEEFKEKKGISIGISYHSIEDDGDKYDQIDGAFFGLDFDEVFQMTPVAQELQENTGFDMKFFVTFG